MMKRGLLIDIEGVDASGKTTQLERLIKRMSEVEWVERDRGVTSFAFPRYDTPVGQAIKRHPQLSHERYARPAITGEDDALSFEALMLMDKVEAACEIERSLSFGTHVVTGRWAASALAYGSYSGHDLKWLERLYALLPRPDLTLLIDVDPELAVNRRPGYRDRYESNRHRQHHVRKMYLKMCAAQPGWVLIDGAHPVDDVAHQIWEQVWLLLGRHRSLP